MGKSKILIGGLGVLTICALIFSGCDSSKDPLTPEEYLAQKLSYVIQSKLTSDLKIIDDSLERWDIIPLIEPKGVRFTVEVLGTGPKPTLSSNMTIKLKAKYLRTGITVYQQDETIHLYDLVIGVQTTLPLLREGTKCTLYVPSQYAFGAVEAHYSPTVTIPQDSNLIYEIELISVLD